MLRLSRSDGTLLTALLACRRTLAILPHGTVRRRLRAPFPNGSQAGSTGG